MLNQLRLSVIPLLWLLLPAYVLLSHLNAYYGYSGFRPGDEVLVKAVLRGEPVAGDAERPRYTLRAPTGVSVEAGPMWIPSLNELAWRLRAQAQGRYELQIVGRDETATTKRLQVSDLIVRRSPSRSATWVGQLWNPAEAALQDDSPFREIVIAYPVAKVSMFGLEVNWMVGFLSIGILLALVLRGPFGVTF